MRRLSKATAIILIIAMVFSCSGFATAEEVTSETVTSETVKETVEAPAAPLFKSKTDTSVVIYRSSGEEVSMDGETWYKNGTFTGLQPLTVYRFYRRYAETSTTYASDKSPALVVKTKAAATDIAAPVVEEKTDTSFTLKSVEGAEYSIDGENWQDSNVFGGLEPLTKYTVYQRQKETKNQVTGNISEGCFVKTLKAVDVPEGYIGVYTKEDFDNIRDNLDGKYILMNDIVFDENDFSDNTWIPIGSDDKNPFSGILNGNGHVVEGIKINITAEDEIDVVGIFGYNEGTIRNLGTVNQTMVVRWKDETATSGWPYAGGIAGLNGQKGLISNCYHTGSIDAGLVTGNKWVIAGGISGQNKGLIECCYNGGNISAWTEEDGHAECGGISGSGSNIVDCYNTGRIVSDFYYVGISTNNKSSENYILDYGLDFKDGNNNPNLGDKGVLLTQDQFKDAESFEGFDFENDWIMIQDGDYVYPQLQSVQHRCTADNYEDFAGGTGTIDNPYIVKTLQHLKNVNNYPGASFRMEADIDLSEMKVEQNSGAVMGKSESQPFYGVFDGNGHVISELTFDIETDTNVEVGLFGHMKGIVKNLGLVNGYTSVKMKAQEESLWDATSIGGIAAINYGLIEKCYNGNDIIVEDIIEKGNFEINLGGITGTGGKVQECFNYGTMKATVRGKMVYAGGISGVSGYITESYNAGDVIIIGTSNSPGGVQGHYGSSNENYSIVVDGASSSDSTVYLTSEEMKNADSFETLDFDNTWKINTDGKYPYPVLKNVKFVDKNGSSEFSAGNGSEYDPYVIETEEQLKKLNDYPDDKFILMADIKLKESQWTPLCIDKEKAFNGTLDGNNHTISNLNINVGKNNYDNVGLFGYFNGIIKNLTIENSEINISKKAENKLDAGFITGYNGKFGRIENCSIKNGIIQAESNDKLLSLGGIAGNNYGSIDGASYDGNIDVEFTVGGNGYIGGIAGKHNGKASISNSYFHGNIFVSDDLGRRECIYAGGINGLSDGNIMNCFSFGNIKCSSFGELLSVVRAGGIVGAANSSSSVENVYYNGEVSGKHAVTGGIVGSTSSNGKFKNAYYLTADNYDSNKGTQLTAESMRDSGSFEGFDFDTVWTMSSGKEFAYPQLRNNPYEDTNVSVHMKDCQISAEEVVIYTGKKLKPEIKVTYNGKTLSENTDYTVEYKNNINCGEGKIVIKGKGRFTGTVTEIFTIEPKELDENEVTLSYKSMKYTGEKRFPKVSIEGLEKGVDYKVTYSNNLYPGTAKVTVRGKGNYSGTVTKTFKITYSSVPETVDAGLTAGTSSGYDDITVKWSQTAGADGYAVYMKKGSGEYVRKTYTKRCSYKIKDLSDGYKYTFKIVPYVQGDNEKILSSKGKTDYVYTLKKVSSLKVEKYSSSKVKTSWSDINGESGYQVRKMTRSNGKYTTVANYTASDNKDILKAAKGKTYYYKVRAYKTVGGEKVYGPWSDIVSYKVK